MFQLKLRNVIRFVLIVTAMMVVFRPTIAADYPQKSITLIAPFAPGASADGIARLMAKELSAVLGQPVVVENKPGAGGATGLMAVAKSAPDGYTLGMGATGAVSIAPNLPDSPPLQPKTQLQPLAKIADIPLVFVASKSSGITSIKDLISKAKVFEIPVANAGQYTAHHLAEELFASMTKTKLIAAPYKGSVPAVTDVIGGQVAVAVVDLTAAAPHIKSGAIKALAVTSVSRTKLAPDVPTVIESGVAGYVAPAWMGLFLPKGAPADVTKTLSQALQKIMQKPEVQQQILALSAEPNYLNSEQFVVFIDKETNRWAGVIANLPKDKQ